MTQETNRRSLIKRLLTNRRAWAVLILLVGLWLMVFFGTRTLRAYREFEYARGQGLLNGTASVEAIQPWMTIRYIAVAYAVPEEYIYAKLNIPFDRRSERDPLGRLGRARRGDGPPSATENVTPAPDTQAERDTIINQMREIILAYRENPVAPGLRDIRPWMSLAYIANSTGVPIEHLLTEVAATAQSIHATAAADRPDADQADVGRPHLSDELDTEENRYKPLELLSDDLHYPGGQERLLDAVRAALATYDQVFAQE
jgi:hypothetical protein